MSMVDYTSLQARVVRYLKRTDLDLDIPDLITMAEVRLNRRLRLRAMENRVSGTSTGGTIALPTGYKEARCLHISTGGSYRRVDYVTPERAGLYPDGGNPQCFTVVGNNIELEPTPTGNVDYRLVYYKAFDPLATATQNWLLLNAPDLYLYATLMEAAPFIKGDARVATWSELLERGISDLEADDNSGSLGGNAISIYSDNSVGLG